MAKVAVCDSCGATDDLLTKAGVPYLNAGVVLQIRGVTMTEEISDTLEICQKCRGLLFQHFPKLKEKVTLE